MYFLPRKAVIIGEKVTDFNVDNSDDTERFRMYVTEKLMCISDSFYDISKTFDSMSDKQTGMDMSDISLLFDTAADRVCKNCERANFCWKKDFNATYAAMFKFLEIMERKGSLQLSDVPKCFSDKCVHLLPLITEINRLFEIYKINRTWKNKLQENRELTSEQFKGISEIIKNAASEICGEKSFDIRSADEIKEVLNDMGISAQRVNVVCDKNGKYMVEISVLDCDDFSVCQKRIKPVIKKVLGINVAVPYNECDTSDSGKCCIRFCQVEGFDPSIGVASLSSNGESGDKHYTNYLSGGKLAVTISDGMGTGHKAAIQSDAIVKLLGSFLEAGFDKTIAVKLVNSVMVMKSARDAFATVDMCVIDLYTGEIEFIKNGAEASYIKHTEYTETVRAASLPIGIVSIGDIETFARTLENGSMVVMTSDGVISAAEDNWIRELVEVIDMEIPPKELAQIILDEAVKRNAENGIENDDMTVWYSLAGGNNTKDGSSIYAASPRDGMDNYFIYTYKNVNYCGAGHSKVTGVGKDNNDERYLYINIICNSVRNSVKQPTIYVYDYGKETNNIIKRDVNDDYYTKVEENTSYPEFSFKVTVDQDATLKQVRIYYDLDYSETNRDSSYVADKNHVLIADWNSTQVKEGIIKDVFRYDSSLEKLLNKDGGQIAEKYVDSDGKEVTVAATKLKLQPSYFENYNNEYTYIVIEATDSEGNKVYQRIKVMLKDYLFDLT